ncbi:MAG: hypothetical protein C0514_07890 [Candidatus Puniceispirillum sp.]|nr:hypothetical protein [Candidatus Puniceispirillum sp.]
MSAPPLDFSSLPLREPFFNRFKRALLLMTLGLLTSVLYIDHTAINLALPHITYHLKTTLTTSQWIMSAYDLAWALVVIPAGFYADAASKRLLCLFGMTIFAVASLVAGMSQSPWVLIGARILQGIGTGLYFPTLYGIIRLYFHHTHHSRAIGSLCLWSGLGMAVGPFLGGFS